MNVTLIGMGCRPAREPDPPESAPRCGRPTSSLARGGCWRLCPPAAPPAAPLPSIAPRGRGGGASAHLRRRELPCVVVQRRHRLLFRRGRAAAAKLSALGICDPGAAGPFQRPAPCGARWAVRGRTGTSSRPMARACDPAGRVYAGQTGVFPHRAAVKTLPPSAPSWRRRASARWRPSWASASARRKRSSSGAGCRSWRRAASHSLSVLLRGGRRGAAPPHAGPAG